MRILVTGGAGFIGSEVIRLLIRESDASVVNVDKLTYAANLNSLTEVADDPRYHFERVDICDAGEIARVFKQYRPDAAMHLAAESHVDRAIDGPADFIKTNVIGTYVLLETALLYWSELEGERKHAFRLHHVSTDEVFGSAEDGQYFTEDSPYRPNSPYSASKASADHLVRAWHKTYGLPVVMSNCSNNYGPYQFPEKLIPLTILNAIEGEPLPVYGRGENVRDWLYVDDHARALWLILRHGRIGESYNVGGNSERTNLQVVRAICGLLDRLNPEAPHRPHEQLIDFVTDRPGHDLRYAIDRSKIERELGWRPRETFESGLERTVRWYLDNRGWWQGIRASKYWGQRLGLGAAGASQ